jgi:hypothetical protein
MRGVAGPEGIDPPIRARRPQTYAWDIRPGGQDGHKMGPNLVPSLHRLALVRLTLTGPSG